MLVRYITPVEHRSINIGLIESIAEPIFFQNSREGNYICIENITMNIFLLSFSAKSCGNPGNLPNGKLKSYIFTFKSKVYFECNHGYKVVGDKYRQCQANQRWGGKMPTCERKHVTFMLLYMCCPPHHKDRVHRVAVLPLIMFETDEEPLCGKAVL